MRRKSLVSRIAPSIESDTVFDLIGGSAETVATLLSLYRHRPLPAVLETAVRWPATTSSPRPFTTIEGPPGRRSGKSTLPLTGFGHGTAGIALGSRPARPSVRREPVRGGGTWRPGLRARIGSALSAEAGPTCGETAEPMDNANSCTPGATERRGLALEGLAPSPAWTIRRCCPKFESRRAPPWRRGSVSTTHSATATWEIWSLPEKPDGSWATRNWPRRSTDSPLESSRRSSRKVPLGRQDRDRGARTHDRARGDWLGPSPRRVSEPRAFCASSGNSGGGITGQMKVGSSTGKDNGPHRKIVGPIFPYRLLSFYMAPYFLIWAPIER